MNSISANLNVMIKASEKASKILIRDFGEIENLQVSKRGLSDFVTKSDIMVKKIIIEELKKARPNYSIISEENGSNNNKEKNNTWIINPIDGIINFLHGIPHFAISIALKSNEEIISGLIFDPIKNEIFFAEKENGAFCNNHRIRVSKKNEIKNCLFATGERIDKKIDLTFRNSGCPALDMAYVAAGRYDGYFQKNLNLWDVAAGIVLVKEAGGIINDINLKKDKNLEIVASTPDTISKFNKQIENLK